MSSLLPSGKKKTEKRSSNGLCCYCSKVFKDPRALGGHLRAHRGQTVPKKSFKVPSRPSSAMKPPKVPPRRGSAGGSGSNQGAAPRKENPLVFPKRLGYEHRPSNNFTPKNTPNTYNPNYSVPLKPSTPSGSDVVYLSNTNPSLSPDLGNGVLFSGNAKPEIVYQNHGTQWHIPGVPTNAFFPYQDRFPEQGEFGRCNSNPVSAPIVMKPYSSEASELNPPRTTKINPTIEPEMRPKKAVRQLLLFEDLGKHLSGLEKFIYGNEEAETDLDLSLRL